MFLKWLMPESLVKLTKRRTRSGTLPYLLGLIKHRLSGQGSNILCSDTGNDWDACRVKVTLRLAHSISVPMQKVIPTDKGQIAETKSAIKRGIEADSFAWLKDDCKDLVLLLTKR